MNRGLLGLAGADQVGITVTDLEAATRFFLDVIGRDLVYEVEPFVAQDDWMAVHLGVRPGAVNRKLRMLRCRNGPAFDLFGYDLEGSGKALPSNSDVGAAHQGFVVDGTRAAVEHLRSRGVQVQGAPTIMTAGLWEGD